MKKQNLKNLSLNKKSISNFAQDEVSGGTGISVNFNSCTGMATCANCTEDCHTSPYETVYFCVRSINVCSNN